MKILAIETSCEHASVALSLDGVVHEHRLEGHVNHSEHLLASINTLLREADLPLVALDGIAFGAGPGAFTGLRLACGVAQGLAMGAGLGVAAISSLAALAMQAENADKVFVITDARMGEVYWAAYRVNHDEAVEILVPTCSPPGLVRLPDEGEWALIGAGLGVHECELRSVVGDGVSGWHPERHPRATDVARLARAATFCSPEHVGPVYVRNKVAFTTDERRARGARA